MHPAVFLDRDNTLIANDADLGDPERVRLLAGVPEGLKALRAAGYRLVVVTNQGGVARGVFSESDVDAVNQRIATLIEAQVGDGRLIERFYYCPYHPEGAVEEYRREHPWRKPRPGMLLQAARDLGLDLARSWMIGDQPRDVEAGQSAGCRTVLLGERAPEDTPGPARPTASAATFPEAVQLVLRHTPRGHAPERPAKARQTAGARAAATPARHAGVALLEDPDQDIAGAVVEPKPPAPARQSPRDAAGTTGDAAPGDIERLRRAVTDLADELRSRRQRRAEFTAARMAAALCQLLVLTLATLGLLQLGDAATFMKWMAGAALLQLITITLLIVDGRE